MKLVTKVFHSFILHILMLFLHFFYNICSLCPLAFYNSDIFSLPKRYVLTGLFLSLNDLYNKGAKPPFNDDYFYYAFYFTWISNHKKNNIFCYNLTNYFVILGLVDMAEGVIKTSQSVEGKQLSSSTLVRK